MGYKTKSMINAKGAYAGGNVDPGYDTAANLKTSLTETGGSLGALAGAYYTKSKKKPNGEKEEITPGSDNAKFIITDRNGINTPTESNPVVDNITGRTQPFSSLNQEENDFNTDSGYSQAKAIMESLNPTLTGKNSANEILESLDYNKKSRLGGDGLKMMGGNDKKGFREAFDSNRTAGKKEFKYEGKMYNTKTAEDVAEKLTSSQLKSAENKSVNDATKYRFKSKSKNEIAESYIKEGQYRMGDKLEAMGLNPMIYSDRMKGNFLGSAYSIKRPNKPTGDGFSKGMLRKNKYNK